MIKTRIPPQNPEANLREYYKTYRAFSWSDFEEELTRSENGKVNIVNDAVDRWAAHPEKQKQPALVFEKGGKVRSLTYLDLKEQSCRWANLLVEKGLKPGTACSFFFPRARKSIWLCWLVPGWG